MRIGQLAKRTGVSVQTLRFYEAEGILAPVSRTASRYRIYGEDSVERVRYIKRVQEAGASLGDIRRILEFRRRGREDCRSWIPMLKTRKREYEEKLADARRKLASVSRLLRISGRCLAERSRHPGETGPNWCPIILEFSRQKVRCKGGVIDWKGPESS